MKSTAQGNKLQTAKRGGGAFVCDWEGCMKRYTRSKSLKDHKRVEHKGQLFVCDWDDCTESYSWPKSLQIHKRVAHKGQLFVCDWDDCTESYSWPRSLQIHKRVAHKGQLFVCDWEGCMKAFTRADTLQIHKRVTHEGQLFVCDWEGCDEKYSAAHSLRDHKRVKHEGRLYVCGYAGCSKVFETCSGLSKHKKQHAKSSTIYASNPPDRLPEPSSHDERPRTGEQNESETTATPGVEDSGQNQPGSQLPSEGESRDQPHHQPQQTAPTSLPGREGSIIHVSNHQLPPATKDTRGRDRAPIPGVGDAEIPIDPALFNDQQAYNDDNEDEDGNNTSLCGDKDRQSPPPSPDSSIAFREASLRPSHREAESRVQPDHQPQQATHSWMSVVLNLPATITSDHSIQPLADDSGHTYEPSQARSSLQAGPTASPYSTNELPCHRGLWTAGDDTVRLASELDYSGHPVTALSAVAQSTEGEAGYRAAKPDSPGQSTQPTESQRKFKPRNAIKLLAVSRSPPRAASDPVGGPTLVSSDEIQSSGPQASWLGRDGAATHVSDESSDHLLNDSLAAPFDEDAGSDTTLAGQEDWRSLTPAPVMEPTAQDDEPPQHALMLNRIADILNPETMPGVCDINPDAEEEVQLGHHLINPRDYHV